MRLSFKIFITISILIFCFSTSVKCQSIELQAEGGAILPSINISSNNLLKQSVYQAAVLRFSWQPDTTKTYSKIYNYYSFGFGLYSATFHNQAIGDPLALYFFIKTPLVYKKTWNIFYEIGSGIAGNFNPYNKLLNPANELIGSRINMFGHLAFGFEYHISNQFTLALSVGYRHFSNGFIKWPNYGINVIPLTLSGTFNLPGHKNFIVKKEVPVFLPYNQFVVFYAPGSKNFNVNEKNYFASTLGLLFIRQLNYKTGLGAGFDVFYNDAGKYKVQGEENALRKTLSYGIYASFEWVFTERFRINTGAGLYLVRHAENDEHSPFYERISARYLFTKNLFAGIGIKINGNASDYIEWTLGYVFKKDKNFKQL